MVRETEEEEQSAKNVEKEQRGDEDYDRDNERELTTLKAIGSFKEIMLWGHESTVPHDDAFSKGIGEWVNFAETVSS